MSRATGLVGGALFWAAIALIGCGGKTSVQGPDPDPAPGSGVAALDQSFSDYKEVELTGTIFEPAALGRPGMIRVTSKRPTTLVRQRNKARRRNASAADVHLLVTMLWSAADKLACCVVCDDGKVPCGRRCLDSEPCEAKGETCACTAAEGKTRGDGARVNRQEALDALRSLYGRTAEGKSDAVTLRMFASAALWAEDWTAAEVAYKELLARFPSHSDRASFEVWLAVLHLRRGRFKDAQKLVASWKLDEIDPLAAYTLAWVRFIQREQKPARAAILRAANTWTGAGRRGVARDLLLLLARTDTDEIEAMAAVDGLWEGQPQKRLRLMTRLADEYKSAGRYARAAQVMAAIAAQTGDHAPPPQDYVEYRLRQAEFQFLLAAPGAAADLAIDAHRALGDCAKCPAELAKKVEDRLSQFAVFFHDTYHDCLDDDYYAAAEKLYTHLMRIPGGDADARRGYLTNLKDTRDRANPANGKHNEELLYKLAIARSEAVRACYESVLLGDRALDGSLVLRIEIDQTGAVQGAATEPAEGLEGMSSVAGCVVQEARKWTFPSRTVPGTTTMSIPYLLRRAGAR